MRKRKAISLIELIIYLAITALVLTLVIDLVARTAQQQSQGIGQGEVNANARFLISRLTYSIQNANAVTAVSTETLTLAMPGGTSVEYTLVNGQIMYAENSGTPVSLSDTQVIISPINIGENIYTEVTNVTVSSIEFRFKVKYAQNNFEREFSSAAMLKGK